LELAEAKIKRLENGAHQQERKEVRAAYQAALAKLDWEKRAWERANKTRAWEKANNKQTTVMTQSEFDKHRAQAMIALAELNAAKARLELVESPARADEIRIAQAEVQVARSELGLVEQELVRTTLAAPTTGIVLEVNCQVGEFASPKSVESTIVIVNNDRLRVRAYVEEMDAPRVQVGMSVTITVDGIPGREFRGKVTSLSPRMADKILFSNRPDEIYDTATREVWIDLDGATDGLVIGLRADVTIEVDSASLQSDLMLP
jgi:multidrug resistance efflux pump